MRSFKAAAVFLVPVLMMVAGCGNSGSGTAPAAPFAKDASPGTPATQLTAQDPNFSLTLSSDLKKPTDLTMLPQIDVNIGTVQLTAQLLNMSGGVYVDPGTQQSIAAGAPLPNQPVTFKVLAGPGTIGYFTPVTDKNGVVDAIYTSGDVPFTTTVIIEADTTVAGNNYRAYTSFQIVRGTGVISFGSNILSGVSLQVDAAVSPSWNLMQLIPFKLTDSNGNPRVGVPVTISVYSITTLNPGDVHIDFLVAPVTETTQQTITSDSAGQGIFNAVATLATPPPGGTNSFDVVFKAVTNDPIPVTAYVGDTFSLSSKPATP